MENNNRYGQATSTFNTTNRPTNIISYLGVTPPISVVESNSREKEVTVTLMEELRRQNTFESEEEAKTRYAGPFSDMSRNLLEQLDRFHSKYLARF